MTYQKSISQFLDVSVDLAWQARRLGDHPFGAVLVHQETILLEAKNTVITDKDVTQHAELRLVSLASKKFSPEILKSSTLISSTEPCAMCAGAIYWAGIRNIVFGCSAKTLGEITGGSLLISCEHVFSFGSEKTNVVGPVNEDICKKVHLGFW